jgi:nitrogen regulatory protein P-II 1
MKKIEVIFRTEKVEAVKEALAGIGVLGLNVTNVTGRGRQKGLTHTGRGATAYMVDMLPKVKLETVVQDSEVETVVQTIINSVRTGSIGDGKIFIIPIEDAIRVRTGERGKDAL